MPTPLRSVAAVPPGRHSSAGLTRRRILLPPSAPAAPSAAVHLLSRATFGLHSDEVTAAETLGSATWLEQQLDPQALDDRAAENLVDQVAPTVRLTSPELAEYARTVDEENQQRDPNDPASRPRNPRQEIASQLVAATLIRSIYSPRQLYEVMVEFWTNHFSISQEDGLAAVLKTADDRDVIRRHALGRFRDLLHASAKSPAMLFYLDNFVNTKAGPNENYARELMELHTIGPDGFTQEDVLEVARCFTGLSISGRRPGEPFGLYEYRPQLHDQNAKMVLGTPITSGGGESDAERVLDVLADHPATAQLVCRKLVQRFVGDQPLQPLVAEAATTFTNTDGNIREVLRTIFESDTFKESTGAKIKRPYEFVVSVARGLDLKPLAGLFRALARNIAQMGQRPFAWPAPNGYPDVGAAWANATGMLHRWNLGLAFENASRLGFDLRSEAERADPTAVGLADHFVQRLLQRQMTDFDRETLVRYVAGAHGTLDELSGSDRLEAARRALIMVLNSPYFQLR